MSIRQRHAVLPHRLGRCLLAGLPDDLRDAPIQHDGQADAARYR
jgi:hypothetical protein